MNDSQLVLVVEDEESFVEALRAGLGREGFSIDVARSGPEALDRFEARRPDLILLDVMLPGISGIDVCRTIRARSDVPIIMVSARAEEIDAVIGLEVGADDYVRKPYQLRELVARIRAALRRSAATHEIPDENLLEVGDVVLDRGRHEVAVRGMPLDLPPKEFELLALLMANRGHVVNRETLIRRVWGHDYVGDTKTLDTHIKRLRSKLEDDPSRPSLILTVRGLGYKVAPTD